MKFELRLFREDRQQWAYADIEVDDAALRAIKDSRDKRLFLAQEIVPYIEAMQELK